MLSPGRFGLLLSFGLSLLTSQPVLPADPAPPFCAATVNVASLDIAHDTGSEISSPVLIHNDSASDGQRYLLWYVESPAGAARHQGFAQGSIRLATSADGHKFEPLAASESPYEVAGLILRGEDAFPGEKQVAAAEFGAPHCVRDQNNWQVTFSKLGFDSAGRIAAAGIQRATSADGTRWQVVSEDPMSLEVVGTGAHADRVLQDLERLAAAYDTTL